MRTTLILQRGGRTYKNRLSTIANDPRQNIQVQTGDTVILAREQQYVMAFGATPYPTGTNSRRVAFENDEMTLAEGLAKGRRSCATSAPTSRACSCSGSSRARSSPNSASIRSLIGASWSDGLFAGYVDFGRDVPGQRLQAARPRHHRRVGCRHGGLS